LKGPAQVKQARKAAAAQIAHVIERHKDTPWAALANRMRKNLHPWRATVADRPLLKRGDLSLPDMSF
jgi:hypothetical protein